MQCTGGEVAHSVEVGLLLGIIGFAAITNINVEVNGENVTLREVPTFFL